MAATFPYHNVPCGVCSHRQMGVCRCKEKDDYLDLRKQLTELREDVSKKDTMIKDLCIMSTNIKGFERPPPTDVTYATSTLGIQQTVIDDRLRRVQAELEAKTQTVHALHMELEMLKADNIKLVEERRRAEESLSEAVASKSGQASLHARQDVAFQSLQERYKEAQDQIAELQNRILTHIVTREQENVDRSSSESKYVLFASRLSHIVGVADATDLESIRSKLEAMSLEHASLTLKVTFLEETKTTLEGDLQAAKDSITRILAESRDNHAGCTAAVRQEMDTKVELLKAQLEAAEALLLTTKTERDESRTRVDELETEMNEKAGLCEVTQSQYNGLLTSLSEMLVNSVFPAPCSSNEGAVKERVRALINDLKIKTVTVDSLNSRMDSLRGVLSDHVSTGKQVEGRAIEELALLRAKMAGLETDASSKAVLVDGFNAERDRILRKLQRLAKDMGLEGIMCESCSVDEIISRLQNHYESSRCMPPVCIPAPPPCCGCQVMPCACNNGFQGQAEVSALRSKIADQTGVISRLRSRLSGAEEDLRLSRSRANETSRKERDFSKMENKLRRILEEKENDILHLKEQLVRAKEAEIAVIDQNMELHALSKNLDKMEKVRQRQAQKIAGLRCSVNVKERGEESALHDARRALEELRLSERQLLEFRSAVSRIVGLDPMCHPEADILERLERLVLANHSSSLLTLQRRSQLIDADLQDPGFGMKLPPQMSKRQSQAPNRIRSASPNPPVRIIDERKY